jgi:hypothetical protein
MKWETVNTGLVTIQQDLSWRWASCCNVKFYVLSWKLT